MFVALLPGVVTETEIVFYLIARNGGGKLELLRYVVVGNGDGIRKTGSVCRQER